MQQEKERRGELAPLRPPVTADWDDDSLPFSPSHVAFEHNRLSLEPAEGNKGAL
jgi:hypothetical protein